VPTPFRALRAGRSRSRKGTTMRHLGLFLMGSLALAACASNNTPPAASSGTVAQATNEPNRGPDFAPASSDGLATAPAERRQAENATGPTPSLTPSTSTTSTTMQTQEFATGEREPVDTTARNAAGTPSDRSTAPATAPNVDADNTRVNKRDRSSAALTPMDQGSSASDRAITQQIRKDLMNDKSLSFTAKNVKVITIDGRVTLRGSVKTEAERTAIEAAARRATGDGARVDSQLEVSK
jgi:hyperosmotically inducible protein